jgi:predicted nicotinamide N-methyase
MEAMPPTIVAGFPTRIERWQIDALSVRMVVVDQLERFVDRDALLSDPSAAEPPYWAHLWTASRVLAGVVAKQASWAGMRVVDIGCGLGLPGVVAAIRGAVVTAVDIAPQALAMTRVNAELNGCKVSVVRGDLCRPPFGATFDFGLAADITYDPALQRALAAFLAAHLSPHGAAWCAESVRTLDPGFRRACQAQGLRVVESEVLALDEERPVPVRVSEIRHMQHA